MMEVPIPRPETTPDVLMVATALLVLLHTPPVTELLRVVVRPTQITVAPEMALGAGVTATVPVTVQPEPSE